MGVTVNVEPGDGEKITYTAMSGQKAIETWPADRATLGMIRKAIAQQHLYEHCRSHVSHQQLVRETNGTPQDHDRGREVHDAIVKPKYWRSIRGTAMIEHLND